MLVQNASLLSFTCLGHRLLDVGGEPVKAFVKALRGGTTAPLNVPVPLPHRVETQLLGYLRGAHCIGEILLISKDEECRIAQLILDQHPIQLRLRILDAIAIVAIHDEDDAIGVLVVVAPEWSEFILATNIPHGELEILVLQRLDIEADGRDGRDDFAQL